MALLLLLIFFLFFNLLNYYYYYYYYQSISCSGIVEDESYVQSSVTGQSVNRLSDTSRFRSTSACNNGKFSVICFCRLKNFEMLCSYITRDYSDMLADLLILVSMRDVP